MKKILIIIMASLLVFSCTLGDNGRDGVLEIAIASPDIYKDLILNEPVVPDRTIMGDTEWLGIIIYPTFAADPYNGFDPPTRTDLDLLMSRDSAVYAQVDYSGADGVFYTFSDLEPGDWTILIFTADYTGGSFETIDAFNDSLTFKHKEFTIEAGYNQVDVPLVLNPTVFDEWGGGGETPVDIVTAFATGFQHDGSNELSSAIMVFSNMTAGEWRLVSTLTSVSIDEVDVRFYTMEGRFLDLERVEGAYDYWVFQSQGTSDMVLMAVTPLIPPVGGSMEIRYDYINYTQGPPARTGDIEIYSGGV